MQQIIDTLASLPQLPGPVGIFLCVLAYLALLLLVRWYLIAKPVRASLRSQIMEVKALMGEQPAEPPEAPGVGKLLVEAGTLVNGSAKPGFFMWSQGQELAAWSLVHRAERMIYPTLPPARARARLEGAVEELRPQSGESATNLVKRVDNLLAEPAGSNADGTTDERIAALLEEALGLIYAQRDSEYAVLLTWHNKSLWLIYVTLALILAASWIGGAQVLLVGAVGGLLSRLARVHRAANLPTDYGAYWTNLFLGPLVGALAAWGGFLLLATLPALGITIEGATLPEITLDVKDNISLLGLAFVLGFSERIFNGLVSTLEERAARANP